MIKYALALTVLIAVAGCAQGPVSSAAYQQEVPQSDAQNRARIHTELGAGYYSIGQLGVALQELAEALKSDPNYAPAYNIMGLVYAALREYDVAEQNYQRALKIAPYDSETHNNYGTFLCQRKREDEAVRHFLAALKNPLYSTPENAYINAGICARNRSDDKSASEFFEKALLIRPTSPQALLGMAEINFTAGDVGKAKAYLARYMQGGLQSPEALWLGVRIERKLGDKNAEASYSLQLQKRFPDSKEALALKSGKYE